MASSNFDTTKKKRGPKPTGVGTPVMVRLAPEQLQELDRWAAAQPDLPTRPEAVRRLVGKALASK